MRPRRFNTSRHRPGECAMFSALARRLLHSVVVIVGVTVLVFVVTRVVGNPARAMLPLSATQEQRAQFEHALGLDKPIISQFIEFCQGLIHFDLGESLWQRRPALEIIGEALPRTLLLVSAGIVIAFVVAVFFGTIAALRPGGIIDRSVVALSVLGLSIPQFWMGLMLAIVLGVILPILPTSGTGSLKYLVLPAITMALPQTG